MAEHNRAFMGMTHNPFADTGDGFFEGGERKAYLEQLRHLSQWSRRVLLVTGADGAGKSTLYRKLSASLEARAKAARVSGMLINSGREVLVAIAQGYGIAAPADSNTQLLTELICTHVEDQQSADRFCITLVDEAELLEPRAIDSLLTLVSRTPMRLVLFGEPRFVPVVAKSATSKELGWHELNLAGFGAADVRAYLEWRFQQARFRGRLPFTSDQIKELTRLSEGLPGRIDQMANVLLVKLGTGQVAADRRRFPAVHRSLILLLVVIVGLGYMLWHQEPEPETLAGGADALGGTDDSPWASADVTPTEQFVGGEGGKAAPEAVASPNVVATLVARSDVAEEPMAEAAAAANSGASVETFVTDDSADSSNGDGAEDVVAARQAGQETARQAGQETAGLASTTATPSATANSLRDASWLRQQPGSNFTLQLLTLSSADRLQAFARDNLDPDRCATYRLRRGGKDLHVLVYGSFESRNQAESAAAALEATAVSVSPWMRPMSQIHDAIATFPQ